MVYLLYLFTALCYYWNTVVFDRIKLMHVNVWDKAETKVAAGNSCLVACIDLLLILFRAVIFSLHSRWWYLLSELGRSASCICVLF